MEGCDDTLFGYFLKNHSKVYRLNIDPRKVNATIPVLIDVLRRSSQVSIAECGGRIYISVPKIICRLNILILASALSRTQVKCSTSAELLKTYYRTWSLLPAPFILINNF